MTTHNTPVPAHPIECEGNQTNHERMQLLVCEYCGDKFHPERNNACPAYMGGHKAEVPPTMQPAQPSADAVECARILAGGALSWQKHSLPSIGLKQAAEALFQQYGDARVAELTQRNAELENKLAELGVEGYNKTA